jgi:tetratricopeptide (TPR) repeat protein
MYCSRPLHRLLAGCLLSFLAGAATAQQKVDPVVYNVLNQAGQAQQSGDYGKARAALEAALEGASEGSLEQALLEQRLGYLALAQDRRREAVEWLERALGRDQYAPAVARHERINLARLAASSERFERAAGLLAQEHQVQPLDGEDRRLLVQVYSRLERYQQAIPLAEQEVQADPAVDAVWYQLLVGMNYRLQRYREAERWQRVLLKRDPGNPEYWRQLAGIQSLDQRQVAAAGTLRLAREANVGLTPTDLDNLVALQVSAGAPWQAARLLEELLAQGLLEASNQRRERLAQLWQQARDHQRAQASWTQLASRSGSTAHWIRVAGIQLERGQWQELLTTLERARPGADPAQRQLIRQWYDYAAGMLGEEG